MRVSKDVEPDPLPSQAATPCAATSSLRPSYLIRPATLLLATCLTLSAAHQSFAAGPLVRGQAPRFILTDVNHHKLDLNAYRGKVVLLNFWATWCAPCQIEMPRFVAWQKQYRARGLQVVGISMDDDAKPVSKLYEKLQLNYPVAVGDEKLGERYGGVLGLPITYLIDGKGQIRARFAGETDLNAIEMQLKSLLPRP